MNLDFYRNYIKIVECGTITAAARELHIAQSALSSQVKAFESEFSATLFVRGARRMELTDAGRILYEKACSVVTLLDDAHKEINANLSGSQGTLHIGITPDYTHKLADLMLCFQKENPQIRYDIYEVPSTQIVELLHSGVIEAGIVRSSGPLPPNLDVNQQIKQQLCVFCSYQNPWICPYETRIDVTALDGVPVAVPRCFTGLLQDIFDRAGICLDTTVVAPHVGPPCYGQKRELRWQLSARNRMNTPIQPKIFAARCIPRTTPSTVSYRLCAY